MVTLRHFNLPSNFTKDLYVAFDKHFWDLWLNYLAPKLLAITPYETRQLQRAMVAARRGGNFTIGFKTYAYYWRFLPEMRAEYQTHIRRRTPDNATACLSKSEKGCWARIERT